MNLSRYNKLCLSAMGLVLVGYSVEECFLVLLGGLCGRAWIRELFSVIIASFPDLGVETCGAASL